jgi:hypothetical protein
MDGSSYCALDDRIAASKTPVKLCRNSVFAGLLRPELQRVVLELSELPYNE